MSHVGWISITRQGELRISRCHRLLIAGLLIPPWRSNGTLLTLEMRDEEEFIQRRGRIIRGLRIQSGTDCLTLRPGFSICEWRSPAKGCKSVFPPTIMVLHGDVTVFREINCPQARASIFVFSWEKLFHELLKVSNWKLVRYLFIQNVLFDVWKLKKTAPIFSHRFVTSCIT